MNVIMMKRGSLFPDIDFSKEELPASIDKDIHIIKYFKQVPKDVLSYVQKNYNFRMGYSKSVQDSYLANHCDRCNSLQGDNFLYDEPELPFSVSNEQEAKQLKLYKINLPYDLPSFANVGYNYPSDILVGKYSPKFNLDLNTGVVTPLK